MITIIKKNKIKLLLILILILIFLFFNTNFSEQIILNFIENLENQRFKYFK